MKAIAKNNKAHFDYDIMDTYDAGLVLAGNEVKSAKSGNISLKGAYIKVDSKGAHLINAHIGPYKYAPSETYNPTRSRNLLLQKKEVRQLLGAEKGMTIIPLELYEGARGLLKLKIGIGKGRKKRDKREYIKKRDTQREIKRNIDR